MATETPKPTETEAPEPRKSTGFTPVVLTRNGQNRTAETATQEAELRFEGWRTASSKSKPKS
jgi:hypothetical protein